MRPSTDVGVDIGCPFGRANAFLAMPGNFPRWASGLGESLQPDGDGWTVQTPDGPMGVRFTPENDFGVLDHWVTPPGGRPIHIPLRVVPNGDDGCRVVLILFRQADMTDEKFDADGAWVRRDLDRLKALLETPDAR